jgi:type VI secretion system protein ImpE
MLAEGSLKLGDLDRSLAELQDEVRRRPADAKVRIFLFQLLVVLGRWDRALNQLNVIGELDAGALAMVHTYREAIHCEALRGRVFAGDATPLVFGQPERWVALLIEALRPTAHGNHEQARALRDEAFELAPATPGSIDGAPFEWIADADPRLGPVVEAIVNGAYYWIPIPNLARIDIEEPSDLRDVVWTPAHLTWTNGGESVALLPTRYPGSEANSDGLVRLARKTEWTEPVPGTYLGVGQRMLATDAGEYPLMDVRAVELTPPATETGGVEPSAEPEAEHP